MTSKRIWLDRNDQPLACKEKLLVLDEAFADLKQAAQDVLEDALLIGCQEKQVRDALVEVIETLENPYQDK